MSPSMKVHVHWVNLMKKKIIQKCQSIKILKEKATKQRTHFLNHFAKQKGSMVKCLALGASLMCRTKKHIWSTIEIHFGIFWNLLHF
jgi:hypothetical protein